jgi:PEP-CTERM motif
MKHLLAALPLVLCALAPRAEVTQYAWTIDWSTSADQSGILSFDDLGDLSPRGYVWGDVAPPPPAFIDGLPPGFDVFGSLSYVGGQVIEVRGCDDALTLCADSSGVPGGYSRAVFTLSGVGSAQRTTSGFESGVTTFLPLAPIPEPGTLLLLASGLVGIGWLTRHRRR